MLYGHGRQSLHISTLRYVIVPWSWMKFSRLRRHKARCIRVINGRPMVGSADRELLVCSSQETPGRRNSTRSSTSSTSQTFLHSSLVNHPPFPYLLGSIEAQSARSTLSCRKLLCLDILLAMGWLPAAFPGSTYLAFFVTVCSSSSSGQIE